MHLPIGLRYADTEPDVLIHLDSHLNTIHDLARIKAVWGLTKQPQHVAFICPDTDALRCFVFCGFGEFSCSVYWTCSHYCEDKGIDLTSVDPQI